MAEPRPSLTDQGHQTENDGRPASVVGVRLLGYDRLAYFDPGDLSLEPGDWVFVETGAGREAGRVVITPRQVRLSMLRSALRPIVRRLNEQDIEKLFGSKNRAAAARAHDIPITLGHEYEQYQKMKAGLPRLGQRVETPLGPGMVTSLQIPKDFVTVRLNDDSETHVFASADLGFLRHDAVNPGEG